MKTPTSQGLVTQMNIGNSLGGVLSEAFRERLTLRSENAELRCALQAIRLQGCTYAGAWELGLFNCARLRMNPRCPGCLANDALEAARKKLTPA